MTQKAHQDESKAAAQDAQPFTLQYSSPQDATAARPYAEAFFRVALKAKGDASHIQEILSLWSTWLATLAQIATHEGVRSLCRNPAIEPAQIEAMVWNIAALPEKLASAKNIAEHFVHLLITRHRLDALPEIAQQFEVLRNAHVGVADAEILTAFPLEEPALKELVAAMERHFGRSLKPHVRVEPALIGGVCVTVGDEVLDTSVRAKLAELHDHLTNV